MSQRNSSSGVSLAIRNTEHFYRQKEPLLEKLPPGDFTVKIANTLEEREAVFLLAGKVYLEKGYIKENENNWLVKEYDKNRNTFLFIVKDSNNNIAGTATLVTGGKNLLPVENLFKNEIHNLCPQKERVVEVSRLVISPDYRNTKEILVLLFNYMFIFGHHVQHFEYCTVQVNPRHKSFYKKLLNFEEIGTEKKCPDVQNAPAVLLFLPLNVYASEVILCSQNIEYSQKSRSLYSYFIHPKQEPLVAHYLASQARPMTNHEITYFGLSNIPQTQTVCI